MESVREESEDYMIDRWHVLAVKSTVNIQHNGSVVYSLHSK